MDSGSGVSWENSFFTLGYIIFTGQKRGSIAHWVEKCLLEGHSPWGLPNWAASPSSLPAPIAMHLGASRTDTFWQAPHTQPPQTCSCISPSSVKGTYITLQPGNRVLSGPPHLPMATSRGMLTEKPFKAQDYRGVSP